MQPETVQYNLKQINATWQRSMQLEAV